MSPQPATASEAIRQLLQDQYRQALVPATDQLFASAALRAGERVLDVGSGAGDTALLAAVLVGPTGFVLATDVSPDAMQGLAERLRALPHAPRFGVETVAAEDLAAGPGAFDAALARNCVMYFRDLPLALRNLHAALRPGGRLVASVYGPLEREPFHAIPIAAVQRRGQVCEPYPQYVQAFRVDATAVAQVLRRVGFAKVEQQVVTVGRTFPSVARALEALRHSRSLGELLAVLPAEQREDAWLDIAAGFRAYETKSGLHLPGEQVVLVAAR